MAKLDLLSLQEDAFMSGMEGKKVIVYGVNDTGKTKQLTKLDRPLLLMTEAGGSAVKCRKVPVTTWSKFKQVVDMLSKESTFDEMYESYRTILVDTGENLVSLSEKATCNEFGVRDLSEIVGRQNGYKICRSDFEMQISKLTSLGYTVVFICHEEKVSLTDEVSGEEYEFIQPKGTSNEKSSMRMLRDLCDFCIYLRPNGINPETYETIPSTAICKRTKQVFARSRFAIQTFINPFTAKGLIEAIERAVEKSAEEEGAEIEAYKRSTDGYTKEDYLDIIKPYVIKLNPICPDDVLSIVESQLGEGRKISSATDEEMVALDNIYNNLVTKACLLGVVVDE
ncbi:MAG: AAA family ATPase [Sarcina sp.]